MDKPNPEYRSDSLERHEDPAVLTPVEARQGEMTGRVRWILAIAVALVLIAFISLYVVYVA